MPRKEEYNTTKIVDGKEVPCYKPTKHKYRTNQATRLKEKDVHAMVDLASSAEHKAFLSGMWLLGFRPQEGRMMVKRDFEQTKTGYVVTLHTLKLGDDGSYFPQERRIPLATPNPNSPMYFYLKHLINYVISLPNDDSLLFDMTTRTMGRIVERLSMQVLNQPFAPYHFRHSCLSWLAADPSEGGLGYSAWALKAFKGSKTLQSVEVYVHTSVKEVNLEAQQRGSSADLKLIGLEAIAEQPAPQSNSQSLPPETTPQLAAINLGPAPIITKKPEPKLVEPTLADLVDTNSN